MYHTYLYDSQTLYLSLYSGYSCETSSITVDPGNYLVRCIVTYEDKRCFVKGIRVTVPSGNNSCSAHLKNRGVTVEGNNVTVEFDGVGSVDFFDCRHMGRQNTPQPCMFRKAAD